MKTCKTFEVQITIAHLTTLGTSVKNNTNCKQILAKLNLEIPPP